MEAKGQKMQKDKVMQYLLIGSVALIGIYFLTKSRGFRQILRKGGDSDSKVPDNRLQTKSYSDQTYDQMADALHKAFNDGWRCTTDEETVLDVLSRLNNPKDWDALNSAFGTRNGTCWGINKNYRANLKTWLKDEHTRKEYEVVKATVSQAGVTL